MIELQIETMVHKTDVIAMKTMFTNICFGLPIGIGVIPHGSI